MNWMSFSDGDGPGVSKVSNVLCHCLKLTYFVRGSITVQLNNCFGIRCFVMLKLSTYILVWLNPNYLNGRSVKHWYLPFTKWVFSYIIKRNCNKLTTWKILTLLIEKRLLPKIFSFCLSQLSRIVPSQVNILPFMLNKFHLATVYEHSSSNANAGGKLV